MKWSLIRCQEVRSIISPAKYRTIPVTARREDGVAQGWLDGKSGKGLPEEFATKRGFLLWESRREGRAPEEVLLLMVNYATVVVDADSAFLTSLRRLCEMNEPCPLIAEIAIILGKNNQT